MNPCRLQTNIWFNTGSVCLCLSRINDPTASRVASSHLRCLRRTRCDLLSSDFLKLPFFAVAIWTSRRVRTVHWPLVGPWVVGNVRLLTLFHVASPIVGWSVGGLLWWCSWVRWCCLLLLWLTLCLFPPSRGVNWRTYKYVYLIIHPSKKNSFIHPSPKKGRYLKGWNTGPNVLRVMFWNKPSLN